MKRLQQYNNSRRQYLLPLLLVFSFSIVYLWISYSSKLFIIKEISCQTNHDNCSDAIIAELAHLKGKTLLSPAISKTSIKIRKNDANVSQIQIKKSFPNSLDVIITKKEQIAQIVCDQKKLFVNIDFNIEENSQQIDLKIPQFSASPEICNLLLNNGSINEYTLHLLLSFQPKIAKSSENLNLLWLDKSTILLTNSNGKRILLPIEQLEQKFQIYQTILEDSSIPIEFKEIDLRFQKAIVKT